MFFLLNKEVLIRNFFLDCYMFFCEFDKNLMFVKNIIDWFNLWVLFVFIMCLYDSIVKLLREVVCLLRI